MKRSTEAAPYIKNSNSMTPASVGVNVNISGSQVSIAAADDAVTSDVTPASCPPRHRKVPVTVVAARRVHSVTVVKRLAAKATLATGNTTGKF
jgi:hypothetical protein